MDSRGLPGCGTPQYPPTKAGPYILEKLGLMQVVEKVVEKVVETVVETVGDTEGGEGGETKT